jgi:hypothetical protein
MCQLRKKLKNAIKSTGYLNILRGGGAPSSVGSTFFSGITNDCRTKNLTKSMQYSDCKLNNFFIRVLSELKLTESASHLSISLQLCQGWRHAA